MANVSIKFNGKEFLLSCDDGQEEHLEELLIQINQKFNDLKNNLGNLGENKLLLITAVKIMDEYFETKKKVDQKKATNSKSYIQLFDGCSLSGWKTLDFDGSGGQVIVDDTSIVFDRGEPFTGIVIDNDNFQPPGEESSPGG